MCPGRPWRTVLIRAGVRLSVPRLRRIPPLWRIRTARILLSKPYPVQASAQGAAT